MTLFELIHFARPYWLIFIPLTLLVVIFTRTTGSTKNALNTVVDEKLLVHLNYKNEQASSHSWLGVVTILLCWLGLAGISWTKAPTTMFENTSKTVFVVDQSLSMYATDIKPNRQTQLKQSIRDILQQSKEGDIALVAFAGEAFVISPFSQDRETITHFLLALEPIIMPVYGSNLTSGIKSALSLNQDSSAPMHLIVLTDSLDDKDQQQISALLADKNIKLDLIAIGTPKGAFIKLPDGRILKQNGKNVIPNTPLEALEELTDKLGGNFYQGRLSRQEVASITNKKRDNKQTQQADNKSINWTEQGHWFALPFLLWLALQFRKGALMLLLLGIFTLPSQKLMASPLDWFMTQDQKAQQAVDQGNWQQADELFQLPEWKAASSYALKNYPETIASLEKIDRNAAANYNLGNALALAGKTREAMQAYEKALEQDPSFKEAKDNLDYLKQQEKQQQKRQSDNKKQDSQQGQKQNQPSANDKKDQNQQPDSKKDNKKNEKQDNKKASEDNEEDGDQDKQPSLEEAQKQKEDKQALNQWLRQIQDDPGLLLQRKLWYLHQERRNENRYKQEDGLNPW
ncbi:vWA domain-containing protein [Marinomonas transparens]|uniref:VWA domain-containing protein n=1 Tax=Marinomonas transparens TaxID=2795388 RepID=A0A934N2J8_9GAMM|nr:VWA domain-containing protein [Marinomonas transparens]MBJ7538837.1 VWA domain-containing protein [Marinomonas transparens]